MHDSRCLAHMAFELNTSWKRLFDGEAAMSSWTLSPHPQWPHCLLHINKLTAPQVWGGTLLLLQLRSSHKFTHPKWHDQPIRSISSSGNFCRLVAALWALGIEGHASWIPSQPLQKKNKQETALLRSQQAPLTYLSWYIWTSICP